MMEISKAQVIDFDKICRFCLIEKPILKDIFETNDDSNCFTIDQKIMACTSIAVSIHYLIMRNLIIRENKTYFS